MNEVDFHSIADCCARRGSLLIKDANASAASFGYSLFSSEYKTSLNSLEDILNQAIPQSFRNVFNEPLFQSNIHIRISPRLAFSSAQQTSDGFLIRISEDFIRVIDIAASARLAEYHSKSPTKKDACAVDQLTALLEQYGVGNTTTLWNAIREWARSESCSAGKSTWGANVAAMIFWVLAHEVAHIACGHLKYFSTAEEEVSPIDSRWAAELMSDSYATIALAIVIDRASVKGSKSEDEWTYAGIAEDLMVCPLLPISLMIGRTRSGAEGTDRNFGTSQARLRSYDHPSELCRFLNCLAAFYFCLRPLHHVATIHEMIPNLFTEHLFSASHHDPGGTNHLGEISAKLRKLFAQWAFLGLVEEKSAENIANDLHVIWANALLRNL